MMMSWNWLLALSTAHHTIERFAIAPSLDPLRRRCASQDLLNCQHGWWKGRTFVAGRSMVKPSASSVIVFGECHAWSCDPKIWENLPEPLMATTRVSCRFSHQPNQWETSFFADFQQPFAGLQCCLRRSGRTHCSIIPTVLKGSTRPDRFADELTWLTTRVTTSCGAYHYIWAVLYTNGYLTGE